MNGALELLQLAVTVIEHPPLWTQGALARDANGMPIDPVSSAAMCRCSVGALVWAERQCVPLAWGAYAGAGDALDQAAGTSIAHYQDAPERTHAEVLAVWRRAIAALAERARIVGD